VASGQEVLRLPALDDQSAAEVQRIVDAAAERGLPPKAVVSEVRLASFAHLPGPRVVAAARAVAQRLEVARDALAPNPMAEDIRAGEVALRNRVPRDVLASIRKERPTRSVAVPLGVLT